MATELIKKLKISIPSEDYNKISELAKEGKLISKIQFEDFPNYSYEIVYHTAMQSEQQSSMGMKKAITLRLKKLPKATKESDRIALMEEIEALVDKLYYNYKSNTEKLQTIREALSVI